MQGEDERARFFRLFFFSRVKDTSSLCMKNSNFRIIKKSDTLSRIIDVTPRAIPSERRKILVPPQGQSGNKSLLLPRAPRKQRRTANHDPPFTTGRIRVRTGSTTCPFHLQGYPNPAGDGSSLDTPPPPRLPPPACTPHRSPPSRPASPRHPLPL